MNERTILHNSSSNNNEFNGQCVFEKKRKIRYKPISSLVFTKAVLSPHVAFQLLNNCLEYFISSSLFLPYFWSCDRIIPERLSTTVSIFVERTQMSYIVQLVYHLFFLHLNTNCRMTQLTYLKKLGSLKLCCPKF